MSRRLGRSQVRAGLGRAGSGRPDGLTPEPQARRSVLRNTPFVLLWSGQTVSVLGNQVSTIALPLLVLALTGSPAQAGVVSAVRLIPYALLFLPVGALIDRWDRRIVMMLADGVRALALGSIPVAFALGHLSTWQIYVAVLGEGAGFVFYTIAQIASLPKILSPAELAPGSAMNEASHSLATLVGPGLGGWIIGLGRTVVIGSILGLTVDAVSYLASVLSLAPIRVRFQGERAPAARSLRAEIVGGLRFLFTHPLLRPLAFLGLNIGLYVIPSDLTGIVLARNELHAGPQVIGLIFSAGGLGALAGSALAPWFKRRFRLSRVTYLSLGIQVVSVVAMAVTGSPVVLAAGMFGETMVLPIYNVSQATYRLQLIPDELQGRVNSVYRLFPIASQPVGLALAGFLIGAIGPRWVFGLIGAGLLLSALWVRLTGLRNV